MLLAHEIVPSSTVPIVGTAPTASPPPATSTGQSTDHSSHACVPWPVMAVGGPRSIGPE
jgi:hypothetical protein